MQKQYEHPGEIVRDWRIANGMSPARLGELAGTSRQNIENLEGLKVRNPQYLTELARVMGYASSDDLRQLKIPPSAEPSNEGGAQPVSQTPPNLTIQAWEGVMNRTVLPVWDVPRWVVVPDGALEPDIPRGDAVEMIPVRSFDDLQIGDVVIVEDEPGNRWMRVFSIDSSGARWARSLRDNKQVFVDFELAARGWPKVIARMDGHRTKRRGI